MNKLNNLKIFLLKLAMKIFRDSDHGPWRQAHCPAGTSNPAGPLNPLVPSLKVLLTH